MDWTVFSSELHHERCINQRLVFVIPKSVGNEMEVNQRIPENLIRKCMEFNVHVWCMCVSVCGVWVFSVCCMSLCSV